MPSLATTSGKYTSFAHRILWDAAERHLRLAGQHASDVWPLHLSAGLLAAASFEAYLNYLGEEMLPHVWEQERRFFSAPEYKGTRGKFKRVAEELGYLLPPEKYNPFAGWLELVSLRDRLVHARPKRVVYRTKHNASGFPKFPSSWLYMEARPEKIQSLISATKTLAEELHTLVRQSEFRNVVFGGHPFEGALGFGTRSVEYDG